ncbi:FAS1 domain-containing protein [Phycomyces nitens]|nr:FAS1 domain-containing protein [Phycomyces nitens]
MIMKRNFINILLLALALLAFATPALSVEKYRPKTVYDLLAANKNFSSLVKFLEKNGLTDELTGNNVTILAPLNSAFEKYQKTESGYMLTTDKITVHDILYHILPVSISSENFYDGQLLKTQYMKDDISQRIKVDVESDGIYVGGIKIQDRDLLAENGVVHSIDTFLTPPMELDQALESDKDLRNFKDLAAKTDLVSHLKESHGYTIFTSENNLDGLNEKQRSYLNSPSGTDDLKKFLGHQIHDDILYTHDIPEGTKRFKTWGEDLEIKKDKDGKITVNGVRVIRSDILVSNGVIHYLEGSILPSERFWEFNTRKTLIAMNATKFVDLLEENDLGHYIKDADTHGYTFIVPTDDALKLSEYSKKETVSWLKYHIIDRVYRPKDLVNGALLQTESNDHLGSAKQRVRVHVNDKENSLRQNIQFGRSGAAGEPYTSKESIMYPIHRALELPRDPLRRLPMDLELATFVASIYASSSEDIINDAEGITLFAPTTDAFGRLGMLYKYLLHPESKDKLQKVIKYQAVERLFYGAETEEGEHKVDTLEGSHIILNKTGDGIYLRGSGAADGSDRSVIAKVIEYDTLIANGVVQKVDRVELPKDLEVTNRDLLSGKDSSSFLDLLRRCDLSKEILDGSNEHYTILAPSDYAISKIDIEELINDPEKLKRVIKLHILPTLIPRVNMLNGKRDDSLFDMVKAYDDNDIHREINLAGVDFDTLLSNDDKIVIRTTPMGYSVSVKGSLQEGADVTDVGRSSTGGGVIEIDRLLMPYDDSSVGGLSWWSVIFIVLGVMIGLAILAYLVYFGYVWWKRRRDGRIALDDV